MPSIVSSRFASLRRAVPALMIAAMALAAPLVSRAEEAVETARLAVGDEISGLPVPAGASGISRTAGPILRELKARIAAAPVVVLAFYRGALGAHDWIEDKDGAVDSPAEIRRGFKGAEGSAVLVLTHAGGETAISLVIRASEEVVAARALEAREAERASRHEALADPDEIGGDAAQLNLGRTSAILRPRADLSLPIPVPETADAVVHDAAAGKLTFTSAASVRALETFYRGVLKAQGFAEKPHEPRAGVAELEFVKAGERKSEDHKDADRLVLTFTRESTSVAVTASGGVLKTR